MDSREAYNLLDQFLRNNLGDDDYAYYSQALDVLEGGIRADASSEEGGNLPLIPIIEERNCYRKGLEAIVKHQEIVAGTTACQSSVLLIAKKALSGFKNEQKPQENGGEC